MENIDSPSSPQTRIMEKLDRLGIPRDCVGLFTYLESHKDMAAEGGVCGAVFKLLDIRYRCRTCELDPTCAFCAPCFERGDHRKDDHDYYTVFSSGGSCDCGDVTAMKPSGFCLKHKGTEQIQPIRDEFDNLMGPLLDTLLRFWRDRLAPLQSDHKSQEVSEEVVKLLLGFCEHSGSLLSYISEKIFSVDGLLEVLVRDQSSTLKELLLKLLGEPKFKDKFARVFICYYPTVVAEAIKHSSDNILNKHPLLMLYSVQIFKVPTLTLQLVKENDLFSMLSKCLEDIFRSCAGVDGRLEIVKWKGLYNTTIRVVEDIQFVISHSAVPIHATRKREDITRWLQILRFVQGINPQHMETGIDIEKPFVLGHCLAKIHSYLVGGAFSEEVENDSGCTTSRQELEGPDSVRPAKIPRISQECCISSLSGTSKVAEIKRDSVSIPSSVSWFALECLRTIDSWLEHENSLRRPRSSASSGEVLGRQSFITSGQSIVNLDSEARGGGSGVISAESLEVLSLRKWPDIVYDVSSVAVSVHFPLHRLLSLLFQKSIEKCYGESGFLSATSEGLPSTTSGEFFSNILGGCHQYGCSALLMEHPLRIRVFCAQIEAGLRPKNDNAEWYHLFRWYENSIELDLFLLQCCAAFAPEPDLYVKRILERYDLSEYLSLNRERSSEDESILVQEMLVLIIQIVKERQFCGLTTAECLRRGLVYKLSIGDATHSELVASVPKYLLEKGDLQQILDSVAIYSNPSILDQGMYKLRLECWKELDLYHLHWDSSNLQKAEERYLRFCNILAGTTQIPNWSKIYQPLSGIARLATCKTTLEIVRAVLLYAVASDQSMATRASEGVLLRAMHLLSLALNICSEQRASGQTSEVIPILEFASEEFSSSRHADQSLLSLLVTLMRRHEKDKNENFAEAVHSNISLCGNILKKFAELDPNCFIKLQKLAPEVLNQLSDDSMIGLASDSEERKAKAREKQTAVLEKFLAEQTKFLESQEADVSGGGDQVQKEEQVECSLCHDPNSKSPVCFLIHLQKSRLLSFLDKGPISWKHSSHLDRSAVDVPSHSRQNEAWSSHSHAYDGFGPPDCDGIYLSSCGHVVHQDCLVRYLSTLKNRGGQIVDPAEGEFLCPVCRGIASSLLPTLPRNSEMVPQPNLTALDPGNSSASSSTEVDSLRIRQAVSLMEDATSRPLQQFGIQISNLDSLCRALCSLYFPDEGMLFESDRVSQLLLWDMLKYSIASTEIAARSRKVFTTPTNGSDSLQNELKPSGSILSLLLNIVQGSKSENIHATFLRFRGIQLFVESLCLGPSNVQQNRQEGNMSASYEAKVPDIQFWKRAADPILAHDSFSSLMFAIFCLPTTLLSCKKSYFCLVHIFYLVTITQAIVICCRKRGCSLAELGLKDCLITDICKVIWDHQIPFQHFYSSYIDDSSYDIKDAIRCLGCPFLRRCSLLWELVNSSASYSLSHGSSYKPSDPVKHQSNIVDVAEVARLELMFEIPPIDMVINDDMSRFMAKRWLHHLSTEFKPQEQNVLYCNPSVPFSLVVLPNLYEELLHRYNNQLCSVCGDLLVEPALCLLCGRLCATNCCSPESRFQTHAMACGAGTGVFLLIAGASILLRRDAWQAPWPSPYLDRHGEEEDSDMLRGGPLILNEERYAVLAHIVASHGLDRVSNIQWEEED